MHAASNRYFVQAILATSVFMKLKREHAHSFHLSCAYPRTDNTKISRNNMNAILGHTISYKKNQKDEQGSGIRAYHDLN
jgi:hypothetical protein